MRALAAIRWVLLAPIAIAAWCGVAIAGIPAHGFVEQAFCAAENFREGICYGPEADVPLEILMNAFIGLSAFVVVMVATIVAPSHRRQVAWAVLALGAGVAVAIGFDLRHGDAAAVRSQWDYVASAIGAGLLGVLMVEFWLRRARTRA